MSYATGTASHVLARAAIRVGRDTVVVLASQRQGEQLDDRLDALATLTTRDELEALVADVGTAVTQTAGATPQLLTWERGAMQRIKARARELFPAQSTADWILDLR